jgi:hypothetical protein
MNLDVDIPCPKCNRKFKQDIRKMKPKSWTRYPHCGTQIEFTGDDASKIGKSIEESMTKISRSFDDMNKRLKK